MSQWSHENPELVGTDADPWMANPAHAAAAREVAMYQQFPNLDAMIAAAEADSTHECLDCDEVQSEQPHGICRECGSDRVVDREP